MPAAIAAQMQHLIVRYLEEPGGDLRLATVTRRRAPDGQEYFLQHIFNCRLVAIQLVPEVAAQAWPVYGIELR